MEQNNRPVPAVLLARKVLQDHGMEADLQAVKAAHPEVQATGIRQLGSRFFALMATGVLDPVTAYEACLAAEKRAEGPKPPPALGALAGAAQGEQEFLTPEQVDSLTPGQLKDQKTLKKVLRSMTRW